MNILIIATILVTVTILLGIFLAAVFTRLSTVVATAEATSQRREAPALNQRLTLGHPIPIDAGPSEQLAEARRLAAQRAAAMPRGANMRIGGRGPENVHTAREGVAEDPITAVKIALVHGWDLLHVEDPWLQPETSPAAQQATAAVAAAKSPDDLVPGKDYPFIEVTDNMSPDEIRKARIANAKAKSAAIKALKETADPAAAAPASATPALASATPALASATPAPAPATPAPAAAPAEPVAGRDYEEIAITDDMSPEEVRKARIANAKAKSAAAKRFKEQGVTAAPAAATPQADAAPAVAAAEPAAQPATVPAHMPPPDYIEITDDMPPDEIRKARIANAKAKSAYHKALKEAGIDPATVEGA
jgi:hypothetical protein